MLALYRSGGRPRRSSAYRQAQRELSDELGLEPSEELRRLEQAILRQDPALEPPAAAAAASRGRRQRRSARCCSCRRRSAASRRCSALAEPLAAGGRRAS